MRYWLEDPDCRDQYSVIFESGDRTSIYWNDVKEPVAIEERAVSASRRFLCTNNSLCGMVLKVRKSYSVFNGWL